MRTLICIAGLFLSASIHLMACTTAIISGKGTPDGRPLLFKQRDTGSLQNKLMSFSDGKYEYIGIVNTSDTLGLEVWGGYNSTGFAIMNSASYNLNPPSHKNREEREGIVMKKALQACATLADFEKLLDTLPRPLLVSANFGVIDAQGGAAYYETGDDHYVKYDVNDSKIAPSGYLIRTNFSYSGDRTRDMGLSRYQQATVLFYQAALCSGLTPEFLLKDVARCLTHGLTGTNLRENLPTTAEQPAFVPFRDYIIRYSTASAIAVQGVKKGEALEMTTMWTLLGSPLTTVAIPVWLNPRHIYPSIMLADSKEKAQLCDWSLSLKNRLFPIQYGEGSDYLNWAALLSADGKGILQKLAPLEELLWKKSSELLSEWRQQGKRPEKLKEYAQWVDQTVSEYYYQVMQVTTAK